MKNTTSIASSGTEKLRINLPDLSTNNLSKRVKDGIQQYGIEYLEEIVKHNIENLLVPFSALRLGEKHLARLNNEPTEDGGIEHEYTTISAWVLLELIRAYIRKDNLKTQEEDKSKLGIFDVMELEKLYDFLKTEAGKKLLHQGLSEKFDKRLRDRIVEEDEKLTKILNALNDENSELSGLSALNLTEQILETLVSLLSSPKELEKGVDEHIDYIRNMLIGYYQNEAELATKNIEGCKKLMTRRGYSLSYKKGDELFGYYDQFMRSQHSAYARFHELNREASADTLSNSK